MSPVRTQCPPYENGGGEGITIGMSSGEPDVGELISVGEAIRILDAMEVRPRAVEMGLGDAQGLVLAEDLHADRDYPPFDKSLMDGFAVRCADVAHAPAVLR